MIAPTTPKPPRQKKNLIARSRLAPETVSNPRKSKRFEPSFKEPPPKIRPQPVLSRYRDIAVPVDTSKARHGDQAWLSGDKQIYNDRYGAAGQRGWIPESVYRELKRRSGETPRYKYDPFRPGW